MAARTISPEILHKIIKRTLGPYVAFVPMAKKMLVRHKKIAAGKKPQDFRMDETVASMGQTD